ncbi:MAG: hypothetical protein HYR48_02235 [Gemmatimonadetes bacterium]|nr:hypothetical protein [Gemmatimonadota bacterium]
MRRAAGVAFLILAAASPRRGDAQTPAEFLRRGVEAYQNLDYDAAATLLRGALAAPPGGDAPDAGRTRALVYLAATEVFRGNRDSAAAAFRRLVLLDARYRPDQMIFPPEVSSLYDEVRLGTKAVSVAVAPRTEIRAAGDRLVVRLYATSSHELAAVVTRRNGAPVRTLYRGAIGDSLEILWDGRDSAGVMADSGQLELRIASRSTARPTLRLVQVPLEIRQVRSDTLPLPPPQPDSLFRPERSTGGGGVMALARGALAAAAVLALPPVVGGGADASTARFAVSGAIAASGLLGFLAERPGRPIPANIAANRALRDAWQRRAEEVRAQNAERRRDARLVIIAGRPVATESP